MEEGIYFKITYKDGAVERIQNLNKVYSIFRNELILDCIKNNKRLIPEHRIIKNFNGFIEDIFFDNVAAIISTKVEFINKPVK